MYKNVYDIYFVTILIKYLFELKVVNFFRDTIHYLCELIIIELVVVTVSEKVLVEERIGSKVVVNRAILVNKSYRLNLTILSKPNLKQQHNGTTVTVVLNLTRTEQSVYV